MTPIARQLAVRRAALRWLEDERARGHEIWSQSELASFTFQGERTPLIDAHRALLVPPGWTGALSMRSVYRAPGAERRHEDGIGPDGLYRYAWRHEGPDHAENRGLRDAMLQHLPMIWFYPVAVGEYLVLDTVYLLDEEREDRRWVVALGEDQRLVPVRETTDLERRYTERSTRQRLHHRAFQASVLWAYDERCAVCALHHRPLLEAAHITRSPDAGGAPLTSNGLALCKIHYAAFSAGLLGIRPDMTVHIRADLMREVDGPMLKYGLQEHHDKRLLVLPRAEEDRPDPKRIAVRYELFLAG